MREFDRTIFASRPTKVAHRIGLTLKTIWSAIVKHWPANNGDRSPIRKPYWPPGRRMIISRECRCCIWPHFSVIHG